MKKLENKVAIVTGGARDIGRAVSLKLASEGAKVVVNYFDNKEKEASVNVQRRGKTVEAFNRLPEEFTTEDVMRCFGC